MPPIAELAAAGTAARAPDAEAAGWDVESRAAG